MKLALYQGPSPNGDLTLAVQSLTAALQAAAAMGAACLVAPEAYLPGYNHPDVAGLALPQSAPALQALAAAAKASQTALVLGYAERESTQIRNAAIAFGPDGKVLANYHKIQLYGPREKSLYAPGDHYRTFLLQGRKTALLICYDVEFAPHIKALADQGVEIILVPTANMLPFTHVSAHTVPAMAANHGVTIVYANFCGQDHDLAYVGGSLIAGPHGEVLAQAGAHAALLVAEIPARRPPHLSTQSADLRLI